MVDGSAFLAQVGSADGSTSTATVRPIGLLPVTRPLDHWLLVERTRARVPRGTPPGRVWRQLGATFLTPGEPVTPIVARAGEVVLFARSDDQDGLAVMLPVKQTGTVLFRGGWRRATVEMAPDASFGMGFD